MLDGAPQMNAAIWGVIALAIALAIVVVVMARVNLRARGRERKLIVERTRSLVDMDFLDQLASAAPPESIAELFAAMAQDCRGCIDDIREAAKLNDFERVQEECAALAESCDAFGATGLANHARSLRQSIADREFGAAGRLMVELDGISDKTFKATSRLLKDSARRRSRAS
jgi:HPt (histidine-containing phosphotransfer) domain-containing protein